MLLSEQLGRSYSGILKYLKAMDGRCLNREEKVLKSENSSELCTEDKEGNMEESGDLPELD